MLTRLAQATALPVAVASLLLPAGAATAASGDVAHRDARGVTHHVDRDPRGDAVGVDRAALRRHPQARGEADLVRTTYVATAGGRLRITWQLAHLSPRARGVSVEVQSLLRANGKEYVVDAQRGQRGETTLEVSYARTQLLCSHAAIPVQVRPAHATIGVDLPARCVPGRVLTGAEESTGVTHEGRGIDVALGTDEHRARWALRLR